MTRVRMGFHRMTGQRDDWLRLYIDAARPPLVKFFDNFPRDLAAFCRERDVSVVGRVYFDRQPLGAEGGRRIDRVVAASRACPEIDIWELDNEDHQSGNDLARYSELSIAFMQAINAVGRKAAIGSFSTGTLDIAEWARFLPALKHAAATSNFVALHEYGGGPIGMKWGVGRNQWNNGQPVTDDDCERAGLLGWWVLRYRRAVVEWRRLGMGVIPRIIGTEGGLDDIAPRSGHGGKGYKDYIGEHPPHVGDYADQWAWASRRYSEDDYFYGAVDFGWATADPQWSSFDVSTDRVTFERLLAEGRELRGAGPDAPTPTPPEPPMNDQALATILRRKLGNRFEDVRASMPTHPTMRFASIPLAGLKGIAIHHSAGPRDQQPVQIASYHISKPDPFAGIGYHLVIRHGVVYYVGNLTTARAHVAGRNHELTGICVTGDYTKEAPHGNDLEALKLAVEALDEVLGRRLPINGHGGWALPGHSTECPGALVGPARAIRETTPADVVDYGKVVWAVEEATRALEREGRKIDAGYIKSVVLPPLIEKRDRR